MVCIPVWVILLSNLVQTSIVKRKKRRRQNRVKVDFSAKKKIRKNSITSFEEMSFEATSFKKRAPKMSLFNNELLQ